MDQSRWIVAAALAGVLLVALVFFETYNTGQVSYTFNERLVIAIANRYINSTRAVVIANNIGVPGGIVASTRYLSDGVSGYYPLFTRDYFGHVRVASKVHRDYTLGDFFEVWGEPLGPLDTLGYHANLTATVAYFWSMCLIDPYPANTFVYRADSWGSHILRNNETITLTFAVEACA